MSQNDFNQFSLLELFHQEAENQTLVLTQGLLALEREPADAGTLEALMRAAHSLKGAARIVGLEAAVLVTHAMEDCFVAAQKGAILLTPAAVDVLLKGVDLFNRIAQTPAENVAIWKNESAPEIEELVVSVRAITRGEMPPEKTPSAPVSSPAPEPVAEPAPHNKPVPAAAVKPDDRVLRVAATNLNRLLGLAGEALVESRWLSPYAESLLRLKRQQTKLSETLEALRELLAGQSSREQTLARLAEAQQQSAACIRTLGDRHGELELYTRRSASLSHRLYREVLASRMRPFADGIQGFQRMVRDLARQLGKEVELQISGEATPVDREVLERLEAPLTHLLRNAVDHGLETPQERLQAGKPRAGQIRMEARHVAGLLMIAIEDDGQGVSLERLRRAVAAKNHTTPEVAANLSDEELLDFLFLPGFSLREEVTEISGRGVGLARLARTLEVARGDIETLEGREHVPFEGQCVGIVSAAQIFGKAAPQAGDTLSVVILGDRSKRFGVVVDRFLGERQLVVQPLDPRLGKIKDISAGALMPDGSPVLILDVDDVVRSVELLISRGGLDRVQTAEAAAAGARRKRVLVVDDSLTVRELERKLISSAGYEVEVAVDGMDGWNAARTQAFDLVVTDIDMPRLDGIELVRLIKNDPRLKELPVMIVSYKDRPEDRTRGLQAGADYYLTKGSFHDETLLNGIVDLIGRADNPD